MRHTLSALLLLALLLPELHAAFGHPSTSPAGAACGGTLANPEFTAGMILHTPAAACLSQGIDFELAGQRLYSLSQLDAYLAAAAVKRGRWGMGAVVSSMGESELYLETALTGCVGYVASKFLSTGISVSYNRADMGETYGAAHSPSLACGVMIAPSSCWRVNLSVKNPFEPVLLGHSRLHREISTGVTVTRFEDFSFAVELSSRSAEDPRLRIGETYTVSSALSLSAGIVTSPFVPSFGCAITWKRFSLLYAYRYHPQLGGTHVWGIALARK